MVLNTVCWGVIAAQTMCIAKISVRAIQAAAAQREAPDVELVGVPSPEGVACFLVTNLLE